MRAPAASIRGAASRRGHTCPTSSSQHSCSRASRPLPASSCPSRAGAPDGHCKGCDAEGCVLGRPGTMPEGAPAPVLARGLGWSSIPALARRRVRVPVAAGVSWSTTRTPTERPASSLGWTGCPRRGWAETSRRARRRGAPLPLRNNELPVRAVDPLPVTGGAEGPCRGPLPRLVPRQIRASPGGGNRAR